MLGTVKRILRPRLVGRILFMTLLLPHGRPRPLALPRASM